MGIFDFFKPKRKVQQTAYDPPGQHAQIIRESMGLLETTTNPGTYFSRYRLVINEAVKISSFEEIIYDGKTAAQLLGMLQNEKDRLHREFIDRMFAAKKENQLVYRMHEAGEVISSEALSYFIERLNGRNFHFVRVCFDSGSDKKYTYVTEDRSIMADDIVTVLAGTGLRTAEVVSVFDASLEGLTFPVFRLRCVERSRRPDVTEEEQYSYDEEGNWKGHPLYCPKEGQYLYDLEGNWKGDASYHADELQDYYSSDGGLEVKTAHVTQQTHILKQDEYICSNCGYKSLSPFTKCPSCKAQIIKSKYDPTWVDEIEMMDIFFGD